MTSSIPTPDFRDYPMEPGVVSADAEGRHVRVRWSDGMEGRFHAVWLRDNAAGEGFTDPHSRERIFDILDVPADVAPVTVTVGNRGELLIGWPGASGLCAYHPGWLRAFCYDAGATDRTERDVRTWDAGLQDRLPVHDGAAVAADPGRRLAWFEDLDRFGLTVVTGTPVDAEAFAAWLEAMLIVRDMNWGKYADVIYQPDGEYIANKGIVITPHVDGPTREHMPGVQLFHCIANTVEGGESSWTDGFRIAEVIRDERPDDFRLLTTVPWTMANRHPDTLYTSRAPIITLDGEGAPVEVRDTHWLREPLMADFDLVEPLYDAYRRYAAMTRDPAFRVHHRLRPGETAVIDNRRVLHARGAYVTGEGERHMVVCYSEREEIASQIAVLRRDVARAAAE